MLILLSILLGAIVLLAIWFILYFSFSSRIGSNPEGARLSRIQASSNYRDGKFLNVVGTDMRLAPSVLVKVMWEMVKGGQGREPKDIIPTVHFDRAAWDALPDTGYAIAWFGHSSVLIKMDGVTFLTDPVFGERASTFSFAGPKRFHFTEHMRVDLLPKVDVVLLSHDHYDHLDAGTIKELLSSGKVKDAEFVTALGVGAHLEEWGVPPTSIIEKDWWESATVKGIKLTLAPSRHFSGRSLTNRFSTLWGSWAIEGRTRKIYFGADSGYSPSFREVGERLGPFDLALLECGAYNVDWANIHMMPEETAQAAVDLKARMLMPIHWGKFNLALHPWKEPITRLTAKAAEVEIPLFTPRIGRIVAEPQLGDAERWWAELE